MPTGERAINLEKGKVEEVERGRCCKSPSFGCNWFNDANALDSKAKHPIRRGI